MDETNHATLVKAYGYFGQGNLEGFLSLCTPEFVMRVPGKNQLAGAWSGRAGVYGLVEKLLELTGGDFIETVEHVYADGDVGAVLARHSVVRGGQTYEFGVVHRYRIEGGRLAEMWDYIHEIDVFDAAWA